MNKRIVSLIGALCARAIAALGAFLLSVVVARMVGAESFGQFAIFLSLVGTLLLLSLHGTDTLLLRAVAWADSGREARGAIGLLIAASRNIALPSVAFGVLGALVLGSGLLGSAFPLSAMLFPLILPLIVLLALAAAYSKGRSRPWLSPLFEIGGVSFIAAFGLLFLTLFLGVTNPAYITIFFLIAIILAGAVAAASIRLDAVHSITLCADQLQKNELRAGRFPFTLIALSTFLVQAGSFLLAAPFLSDIDLGLLRGAERLAVLVSLSVLVVDPVMAPRIVKQFRKGQIVELKRSVLLAIGLSGAMATPVLLVLIGWPELALGVLGSEFQNAAGYLQIMALGHFLIAILGPLSMVLNMTGREKTSMYISVLTLGSALLLFPVLTTMFGASGFIFAYMFAISIRMFMIFLTVATQMTKGMR